MGEQPAAPQPDVPARAQEAVRALLGAGATVATAESLTGGLVGAALTSVAGSSAVYRGGVVAYATDLKHTLLGVDAALLAERGPVDPDVAEAMAGGVRAGLGADYGVATTGVAGPDPQGSTPVGTVWVAVAGPGGVHRYDAATSPRLARERVRSLTVDRALRALLDMVRRDGARTEGR